MFDTLVDDTIRESVATRMAGIPQGLDEMEPGPFLGIVLSGIDLDRLSGDDRGLDTHYWQAKPAYNSLRPDSARPRVISSA